MRPPSRAIRRASPVHAITQPPAMAWPLTAVTSGLANVNSRWNILFTDGRKTRTYRAPPSTMRGRSTPAENIRPVPVKTSAAVDGARSHSSSCAVNAFAELQVERVRLAVRHLHDG